MKQITNLDEKHEAVALTYSGNFLNNERDCDPKNYIKLMNSYLVFVLDDGRYLIDEIGVQRIKSTMCYDDETPRPEITEDTFIDYHMHFYSPLRGFEGKRLFIYESDDKTHFNIGPNSYSESFRPATEEEIKIIMDLRTAATDEYLKRLKTYYKRYNSKIRTSGYWKNR